MALPPGIPAPASISGPVGQRLSVPTPTIPSGGQTTHPSIVRVPGGWNGFEYWMAHTPYPGGDDQYEDPCIVASADGVTWEVPAGLVNPIDDQPGSPGAYNSDVDIELVDGTMYLFWRTLDPAAVGAEENLYYSTSTDGVTWAAKTLFYQADDDVRRLVSPCLHWDGAKWLMWAVDIAPATHEVVMLTGGAVPESAWSDPVAGTLDLPAGREAWHLGVLAVPGGYVALLTDITAGTTGNDGGLVFMASTDGLDWETSEATVIPQAQTGEHDALYRATLIRDDIGSIQGWRVWYSAWLTGPPPVWHIYRTWITAGQSTAPMPTAADVAELVSGSHRAIIEARVVTAYQTGPDPEGTIIPVSSGDVTWDATADVWSTMAMETAGVDEYDLSSMFPRLAGDLLAPYGNEVYLRYGIDTGPSTLWTPLGYYRIDDTEQAGSSGGPIRLTGTDRWQGLVDARLITPRQYQSVQTIAAAVYDLVLDVYPDAVVAWDDTDDQLPLGRDLIVEQDRAAALRDIATSRGKVTYFDGEGVLRFETVPDASDIVWDIRAGHGGVLVDATRRVSREGMYNAVVARGQGATEAPALGIALDVGEQSPTRWGSRFGKIPRFYSSPLIITPQQARSAAAAILRRSIGMPYSVDFGTVPNPALRPRQAVRITQDDGNREAHLVETLRLPFSGAMTGTTREQTLTQISSRLPAGG